MRLPLTLPVVLLMIVPGVADAQARKAGAPVYHNATASRIRVTVTRVTDAAGKEEKKDGSWDIAPGVRTSLWLAGKPLTCHKFEYRLTTVDGSSSWIGTCNGVDARGQFTLTCDARLLADHQKSASGEKLKRAVARVKVSNQTGQKVSIACRHFLDADGKAGNVKGGAWDIVAGGGGYLDDLGKPLAVSRFEFTLHTAEGKSDWSLAAPESGEIVFNVDTPFLNRHRAALGLKPAAPPAGAVSEEAKKRALAKILGAMVAHAAATNRKPADFAEALAQQAALRIRDGLIESAVKDAFPARSDREAAAIRRVACLAMEGKLDLTRLTAETAREELNEALKKADAGAGAAADVADFLYQAARSMKR